jgi:hypothetical protein
MIATRRAFVSGAAAAACVLAVQGAIPGVSAKSASAKGKGRKARKMIKKTVFAKGAWEPSEWMNVKSSRWDYVHGFEQQADHVVNECGPWSDEELYSKHVTEVYSSMVLKEKFKGKCRVSSTMSFDHLMAPLIVVAPEMGKSAKGEVEFRRHHEIVLYNEGINIWRYDWVDGKAVWVLAAFLRARFDAKRKYELAVTVESYKNTRRMTVECGGHVLGYSDDALTLDNYVGITGCEGRNRFYDFTVETDLPAHDDASDGEH